MSDSKPRAFRQLQQADLVLQIAHHSEPKGPKPMNEKTPATPEARDSTANVAVSQRSETVLLRVPQGYDAKINIRFVPGRDIEFTQIMPACQPRNSKPHANTWPYALSTSVLAKLKDGNKQVIDWLSKDAANAQLFLARPVEALMKAGVKLDRSEQKALERSCRAVSEASAIGPGVKVTELIATAHPRGRVGQIKPGPRPKDGPKTGGPPGPKGKE